ncbi:hypothetical protein [Gordonia soli]|nr:hypothetical protein [Gordonia soli]
MQGLAALLFPAVLMLFALAMEKVQTRIDRLSVSRDHVEDFLQSAEPANVDTLAKEGFPAAMDELRTRRATRVDGDSAAQVALTAEPSPQRAS